MLISLAVSGALASSPEAAASEYELKAVFLLNFASFVDWPAAAFVTAEEPMVFCVFAGDPFGGALDQASKGKTINGRRVLTRITSDAILIRSCHVIFFPRSQMRGYAEIAGVLTKLDILTVGEVSGFSERGGIINFVVHEGRVRFEVNPTAAERHHLKVSSKLLQLAVITGREK